METEPINQDNIIDTILTLMEQVESFVNKNGQEKKVFVMSGVKTIIGDKPYIKKKYCCF